MVNIKKELKTRIKYFSDNSKPIEEQRIRERTNYDLEMMKEMGYCSGIENFSHDIYQDETLANHTPCFARFHAKGWSCYC